MSISLCYDIALVKKTVKEMLESTKTSKNVLADDLKVMRSVYVRHKCGASLLSTTENYERLLTSTTEKYERLLSYWTQRRTFIRDWLLPRAESILHPTINYRERLVYACQQCSRSERLHWERDVYDLITTLKSELDVRTGVIRDTRQKLADITAERLMAVRLEMRLTHAQMTMRVRSDRGSYKFDDDVIMRLDETADLNNYCITPEPIRFVDWGLIVARCKLIVIKLRQSELICDDLLSVICQRLDDVFYMRTAGSNTFVGVRDFDGFELPEPPGVQVKRFLFEDTDHND